MTPLPRTEHASYEDHVLALLASARPRLVATDASPDSPAALEMLDRLVGNSRPRRRSFVTAAVATAAVVAMIAVGVVARDSGGRRSVALTQHDIQRIATQSTSTLARTGRATVSYVLDDGTPREQRGSAAISFSGNNLDMVLRVDGRAGRPGFDAANRTVDGEFYLLDGPPEAKRWYHDVNARGTRASDLFSLDPRTLLGLVTSGTDFAAVGNETIDGVPVRHLRAPHVRDAPSLNVSLGPIDTASIRSLDIWVDRDDVVRRLDIAGPAAGYSVQFKDLGVALTIMAPAHAEDVAGKG
jgi:hypothetical protein